MNRLRLIQQYAGKLADLLEDDYDFNYNEAPNDLIDELRDIEYAIDMMFENI